MNETTKANLRNWILEKFAHPEKAHVENMDYEYLIEYLLTVTSTDEAPYEPSYEACQAIVCGSHATDDIHEVERDDIERCRFDNDNSYTSNKTIDEEDEERDGEDEI